MICDIVAIFDERANRSWRLELAIFENVTEFVELY